MRLSARDKAFRHPPITAVDYKLLDMDRVLTAFLARLRHNGRSSRLSRGKDLPIDAFVDLMCAEPQFVGFEGNRDVVRNWVETHLVDMVNRGKPTEAVAGLRPLHGLTYRFRSARHSRPYSADEQLYALIQSARNSNTLGYLRDFFFAGVDPTTLLPTSAGQIDVETQAVIHLTTLTKDQIQDRPATQAPTTLSPLCPGQADLLADDIVRLLYHQQYVPRTVMVDYFKALFAFHLALYHLRLTTLLPAAVRARSTSHECELDLREVDGLPGALRCAHRPDLFLDAAGDPRGDVAHLAERSAGLWYAGIPDLIRATFEIKRLDEFDKHQRKFGRLSSDGRPDYLPVNDALELLGPKHDRDRESYFRTRVDGLVDTGEELPHELRELLRLDLDPFTTYIDMIMHSRTSFNQRYIVQCLDSLLLKNRPGAMIAQTRGRNAARRFVLDSRMLEMLVQLVLLRRDGSGGFRSAPLRVDQFLGVLRDRYGLHVDRLPNRHWPAPPGIKENAALRVNMSAFVDRLREIGFYADLSDAYLAQTIRPRYVVEGRQA